jgi:hypothetical protein
MFPVDLLNENGSSYHVYVIALIHPFQHHLTSSIEKAVGEGKFLSKHAGIAAKP